MVIKAKKRINNNNNVEASEKFAHFCGGNIKFIIRQRTKCKEYWGRGKSAVQCLCLFRRECSRFYFSGDIKDTRWKSIFSWWILTQVEYFKRALLFQKTHFRENLFTWHFWHLRLFFYSWRRHWEALSFLSGIRNRCKKSAPGTDGGSETCRGHWWGRHSDGIQAAEAEWCWE